CLKNNVPDDVPGIAFLSGGISDELATEYLKVINQKYKDQAPWRLSFSYGRGLQREPMKTWSGDNSKFPEAQKALFNRAKANGNASMGL
ncbi:class I fructose-bisphosphate aldolase, partial [Nanoarchaeota archaeon]